MGPEGEEVTAEVLSLEGDGVTVRFDREGAAVHLV
jgi:hypothetical protein